jgi:hypothetical protein
VIPAVVFPDTMPDVRAWLRAHPVLAPLHGGRVFFRLPAKGKGLAFPCMRIYQLGGAVQAGTDTPIEDLHISIETWGGQDSDYPAVRQLNVALRSACHQLQQGTLINPAGNTVVSNAQVTNSLDSPDPQTGWPRIICDTVFTVALNTP